MKKMQNSEKIREQIQKFLRMNGFVASSSQPNLGWIRSIRMALGMSGKQLAQRIHVKPPRISELEKEEVHGNITLKSLQRAAEAMGCEFAYAFVPKGDLDSILKRQAEKAARRNLENVVHTMRLENQGLSQKENARQMDKLVAEWVKDPPRWLWDVE